MMLTQCFVSSHYLSSPIVTSSICEHPASREKRNITNETSADDGIDLDSIPVSATVKWTVPDKSNCCQFHVVEVRVRERLRSSWKRELSRDPVPLILAVACGCLPFQDQVPWTTKSS